MIGTKPEINVRMCKVLDSCFKYRLVEDPSIVQMMPDGYYNDVVLESFKNLDLEKLYSKIPSRRGHGVVVIDKTLYYDEQTGCFATYVLWDDRNNKFSVVEWKKDHCIWVRLYGKKLNIFKDMFDLGKWSQTILYRGAPSK